MANKHVTFDAVIDKAHALPMASAAAEAAVAVVGQSYGSWMAANYGDVYEACNCCRCIIRYRAQINYNLSYTIHIRFTVGPLAATFKHQTEVQQ